MYLVDTDVLSALRRQERNPTVADWYRKQDASDLYVSVITVGELQRGISRAVIVDAVFAEILAGWLRTVLVRFANRILDVDLAVANRWGHLGAAIGNRNPDLLIAATALEHNLAVVTRNVRHFEPTGVRIINPFDS